MKLKAKSLRFREVCLVNIGLVGSDVILLQTAGFTFSCFFHTVTEERKDRNVVGYSKFVLS